MKDIEPDDLDNINYDDWKTRTPNAPNKEEELAVELVALGMAKMFDSLVYEPKVVLSRWAQSGFSDPLWQQWSLGLKAYIFGKDFGDVYSIEVPTSWWQHFKRTHFSPWMLRRWPVVTRTISVNLKAVLPYCTAQLPKNQGKVWHFAVDGERVASIPESAEDGGQSSEPEHQQEST